MNATSPRERADRPRLDPVGAEPSGERPIALLAGSFDPPTLAHLALGLAWRAETAGDVVLVYADRTLPKEPGTEPPLLSDAERLEALSRLTAGREGLFAARASHGLLVDQVEAARERWPRATLTVLLGSDKARQLLDPIWYTDRDEALGRLFAAADVRYAERAGDEGAVAAILALPENRTFRDRVAPLVIEASTASMSSSEVRRLIGSGRSVAELVPPEVRPLLRG